MCVTYASPAIVRVYPAMSHVQPRMVGKSQIAIVAAPLRWHSKVMPISNMDSGKKRQNAQERPRGNFRTEVVLTWTEFAMQTETEFFQARLRGSTAMAMHL